MFSLCSLFGSGQDDTKVLFIGNSFTFMNEMPKTFQKIAKTNGKDVFVDKSTKGGADWNYHANNPMTYKKLKSKDWDYVVVQAKSYEPTEPQDSIDVNTIPYGQQIMDSIRELSPNARIILYMTWGYKNGRKGVKGSEDFYGMYSTLYNSYHNFADKFQVAISPVGQVWKNMRMEVKDTNLYVADNFHPNHNGSYISACTFYAALFQERMSKKTYVPKKVDASLAKLIQDMAFETVMDPKEDWRFAYWPDSFKAGIVYKINENGDIELAANSPGAESFQWKLNGEEISDSSAAFIKAARRKENMKIVLVTTKNGKRKKDKLKLRK